MNSTEKQILAEGKYLGERISGEGIMKLYLWNDQFYEVSNECCQDIVSKVEPMLDTSTLDLYIQSMNRTVTPTICDQDKYENLREAGKIIQPILERDHRELLNKLYRDQKLNWFCEMIEARAAYLLDEILPKNKGMSIAQARDVALERLLHEPQSQMAPPYVKIDGKGSVIIPEWLWNGRFINPDEFEYYPDIRGFYMVIFLSLIIIIGRVID